MNSNITAAATTTTSMGKYEKWYAESRWWIAKSSSASCSAAVWPYVTCSRCAGFACINMHQYIYIYISRVACLSESISNIVCNKSSITRNMCVLRHLIRTDITLCEPLCSSPMLHWFDLFCNLLVLLIWFAFQIRFELFVIAISLFIRLMLMFFFRSFHFV